MGRIKEYVKSLNLLSTIYFTFVVLVTIFLLFLILNFKNSFLNYQKEEVRSIKNEIKEILIKGEISDFIELNNDYAFEIIVQKDSVILYSSNSLYDMDEADEIYNNNYIYKEIYEEEGYLVWLLVPTVDIINFVNEYLIDVALVILIMIISTLIFLKILFHKSSKPIFRIFQIIHDLKEKESSNIMYEDKLDNISQELLLLYNEMTLKSFQLEQQQEEYKRIYKVQKSLIEEQKEFLETAIHEIKSPLASINYSRYIIEKSNDKNQISSSLANIKIQSEETLGMVVETLETVKSNSNEKFIEQQEVKVSELIESYLNKNSILIESKKLDIDFQYDIDKIYTNKLKLILIINNVLSNVINYSKSNTKVTIQLTKKYFVFKNIKGTNENQYSTQYGVNRIRELANDLQMKIEIIEDEDCYEVKIILGEEYE